jgi:aryl-alcohol dehydrogenase-like predicted oxidoreductase
VKGFATETGTLKFAKDAIEQKKINPNHFRKAQGLTLTSLGMGTYLGSLDAKTDREVEHAVKDSISSGAINVIDTAINYRFQRAERCVGRALNCLFEEQVASREQVFVSTKNGYLAPDADYERGFGKYVADKLIATGIIRPDEIVESSHCMTVPFLKHELKQSLANLQLDTIDLMYLHNSAESQIPSIGTERYLENLLRVFQFYEGARKEEKVRFYGLATWNCFRNKGGDNLNLEDIVALAEEAGGVEHGFRFIQFPLNLAMPEAFALKNQKVRGKECTLLEACVGLGIGSFTSVPLMQGQLVSQEGVPMMGSLTAAQSNLQFARSSPGVIAPLVGQKDQKHVLENLELAKFTPLEPKELESYLR